MKRRISMTLYGPEVDLLEALLSTGVYGRTIQDVIRRIVDHRLEDLLEKPHFRIEGRAKR